MMIHFLPVRHFERHADLQGEGLQTFCAALLILSMFPEGPSVSAVRGAAGVVALVALQRSRCVHGQPAASGAHAARRRHR